MKLMRARRTHGQQGRSIHTEAIQMAPLSRGLTAFDLPTLMHCGFAYAVILFNIGLCHHLKVTVRQDQMHFDMLRQSQSLYDMALRQLEVELRLDVVNFSQFPNLLQPICMAVLDNRAQVSAMLCKEVFATGAPIAGRGRERRSMMQHHHMMQQRRRWHDHTTRKISGFSLQQDSGVTGRTMVDERKSSRLSSRKTKIPGSPTASSLHGRFFRFWEIAPPA
mmetsp:Transcript_15553/g.43656  ORF Transcript_15553/g.43656 Transcript_15553/m.43656 type:complete len:221 (-) Transcript_15553:195-857(-)